MKLLAPLFSKPAPGRPVNPPGRNSVRFGSDKKGGQIMPGILQDTVELTHQPPQPPPNEPPMVAHDPPVPEDHALHAANDPASRELLRVVKEGTEDDVQAQLDAGADPNTRDRLFFTVLHRAVDRGNPAVVSRLLQHGADPNARAPLFATPPVHQNQADPRAQKVAQVGGDTATLSPVLPDTPLDRALHHKKPDVIPVLILGGATCTDAQRPRVHAALQQVFKTDNLTDCLEKSVINLDGRRAKVLLSVGVQSKKLPFLYADLLDKAIDTATATQTESSDERFDRLRTHHNALQMMSMLSDYVPDHTFLADVIARNWRTLLKAPEDSQSTMRS